MPRKLSNVHFRAEENTAPRPDVKEFMVPECWDGLFHCPNVRACNIAKACDIIAIIRLEYEDVVRATSHCPRDPRWSLSAANKRNPIGATVVPKMFQVISKFEILIEPNYFIGKDTPIAGVVCIC